MSRPVPTERLAAIRDEALRLLQRVGDHQDGLQALVAAADLLVQQANEALRGSHDPTHQPDNLGSLLTTQVQRSLEGAETARRLFADAREQRIAVNVLLAHLDAELPPAQRTGVSPQPDAVLVVDDHGDVREVVAEVLRKAGWVVRTATNGLEGLLAAYEMQPSVIVMDVSMPVLDGIEATRLIKASEATRQARVIAYTGDGLDTGVAQTLFSAVVQKPASPATLLATVLQVASL